MAEFASNSAAVKRDMRRLFEKDPTPCLQAACRVFRECAHAVTSLWGVDTAPASAVLREASHDSDPRVAANALVGSG